MISWVSPCLAAWLPDARLTYDANDSRTSENNAWCVAASGDTVHVTWFDNRAGGVYGIYYKRSTDDGVTWSSDTALTSGASAQYPCIAVSGSSVYVAWEDIRDGNYEIYYKSSTDAGATWGADQRLTVNSSQSWYPSIAVSGPNLDVVWEDGRSGYYNIWEKHSTDGGATWSDDAALTTNVYATQTPAVAISGSGIYVVWADYYINVYDIMFRRSNDMGTTWDSTVRLSQTVDFNSGTPSLAVSGTEVNVIWQYTLTYPQLMYRRSTDLGLTWRADTALTSGSYSATNPSVAARDSLVHVVWQDNRDGNLEIYYKRSLHRGATWDADTRLTRDTWTSQYASIAASRNLYVVWEDNRPGNDEIYSKEFYAPDVATTGIIAPVGTVAQDTVVAPQAIVRNNGTQTAIFPVAFNVSPSYSNVQICTLATGQTRTVTFANWTASTPGSLTTMCTTRLTGDVVPGNDKMAGSVLVQAVDVQITAILAPNGTVNLGSVIAPAVDVHNLGNTEAAFRAKFDIADGYTTTQSCTLAAGGTSTVTFSNWTASTLGRLAITCSLLFANPTHDSRETTSVFVQSLDVQTVSIGAPVGSVAQDTVIAPLATVKNNGNTAQTFNAKFTISDGYAESTIVTLAPGASQQATFPDWTASMVGTLTTKCSTRLAGDMVRSNDRVDDSVEVMSVTGLAQERTGRPVRYALDEPAPNPVRSQALIRYALPEATGLDLSIYGADGRRVANLVHGVEPAGWYSQPLDADALARGVYYVRLRTSGLTAVVKLVRLD